MAAATTMGYKQSASAGGVPVPLRRRRCTSSGKKKASIAGELAVLVVRILLLLLLLVPSAAASAAEQRDERNNNINHHLAPSLLLKEHWFNDAVVDHYNFRPTVPRSKFPLRYLVNLDPEEIATAAADFSGDGVKSGDIDVVLFYAGNEADIWQFANNTGFLFELAESGAVGNALVVFAEHRYYGRSFPFDDVDDFEDGYSRPRHYNSLQPPYNVSFLTVEQAMADYNQLLLYLRETYKLPSAEVPFVVFGGSYGANLAMWLRLKQPNLWAGAVASSPTPLKHVLRETNGFARILTEVYANASSPAAGECPRIIHGAFLDLYELVRTPGGREQLQRDLGLCHPLDGEVEGNGSDSDGGGSWTDVADDLHGWISLALEAMVQYGYPYPHSYYEPVPGHAFREACRNMIDTLRGRGGEGEGGDAASSRSPSSAVAAVKSAVDVFYNYTGQAGSCYDYGADVKRAGRWRLIRRGRQRRHQLGMDKNELRRQDRGDPSPRATEGGGNSGWVASAFSPWTEWMKSALRGDHFCSARRVPANSQKTADEESDINAYDDDDMDATSTAWGYQTCTEVYQPMPTDGITDYDLPYTPNATAYFEYCRWRWRGAEPRPDWEETEFMGADIGAAGSNIFITNGQLDPWRAAGIETQPRGSTPDQIVVRTMEGAAHHLDLRRSHPLDPPSVTKVRKEQIAALRKWIQDWKRIRPGTSPSTSLL